MLGSKRRTWALTLTVAAVATIGALTLASAAPAHVQAAGCKPYGTLSYGIAGRGIPSLDPNTASFAGQTVVSYLVYPSLTKYTPSGKIVPDLAAKWKSSADSKKWWLWIRHDVKYANGRAFTAQDVVDNILRVLDPKVGSPENAYIKDFQSVRAINKYEVRIRLGSPSVAVPAQLQRVHMADLTDVSKLNTVGNGPGPYMVQNFVPDQSLTLVPNPHYFGPHGCFKKIVFVREPDPTAMVTDFTADKLGMVWQVPVSAVPKVQSDKSATILKPSSIAATHLFQVDDTSPPFNSVLARRALSWVTDRAAMVKVAFLGLANPSLANDLLSDKAPGFDKSLKPYGLDLDKAKQLFQQAGVKPGFTFTFWTQAGARPEWVTMGEILQADLQKIGYNLKIVQNDYSTWHARFTGKQFPGLIVPNFGAHPQNPVLALNGLLTKKCHCNYNNKQYDSLYLQALGAADPASRQSIIDKMQQMINTDVPELIIAQQTNIVAQQKQIVGAWEDSGGDVHLATAHFAGH